MTAGHHHNSDDTIRTLCLMSRLAVCGKMCDYRNDYTEVMHKCKVALCSYSIHSHSHCNLITVVKARVNDFLKQKQHIESTVEIISNEKLSSSV